MLWRVGDKQGVDWGERLQQAWLLTPDVENRG